MATEQISWERVADGGPPSWYLDPEVANQKRREHLALIRRWTPLHDARSILKTDLFEEAYGNDHLLFDLEPCFAQAFGIDIASSTVARARSRSADPRFSFAVSDVRNLAFRTGAFDLVVSNSTLDHFDDAEELRSSIAELGRVLRPGGVLIVTLDNPRNPLYPILRWAANHGWAPFTLGHTFNVDELNASLHECGLEVTANDYLIHNPRVISTAIFVALRRILGRYASLPIRVFLGGFALLGRLPTRGYTACFIAACARKRSTP